ncbi:hypothetical protein L3Q82_002255 [Scortum barcoo]|uniref:Uncharacterized protein n=1 Tax=Scortum barcoo TaxID=214431 RepID=A0ACB8W0V5_9TELE|nr:hypothetical protein L3Q82_002255 [Scortum barcoo]
MMSVSLKCDVCYSYSSTLKLSHLRTSQLIRNIRMAVWDTKILWGFMFLLTGAVSQRVFNPFPAVNYPPPVCAVRGSTVTLPCSFTPPRSITEGGREVQIEIIRVRWCQNHLICQSTTPSVYDSSSVTNGPRYKYLGDKTGNCTLQITNIQKEDNATFRFRMEANDDRASFIEQSGVRVTVIGPTCDTADKLLAVRLVLFALHTVLIVIVASIVIKRTCQGENSSCCSRKLKHETVQHIWANDLNLFFNRFDQASAPPQKHRTPFKELNSYRPVALTHLMKRDWSSSICARWPQFVRVQGFESDRLLCSTGAPQGTVLAPFLFTLYTADFSYNTPSCHLQKFSDDSAVVGLITDGDRRSFLPAAVRLYNKQNAC